MVVRNPRPLAVAALAALASALAPLGASAQTSTFYTPPKIVKQGTSTAPVVGTGSVTVQVFVHKDGSIGSVRVEKSTNHGDDAAATEIAKTSKYKPGERDGKPIDAFYTLALKFNGSAVTTDTGSTSGDVNRANALIRAGNYAGAKTELESYLVGHPGDKDAEALLGVADSYQNDSAGAIAAFDSAGTVPDRYKVVAAKAYADAAVDALKAKDYDKAVALAGKSLALQQSANVLFVRGTAEANAQKYGPAIADLERARQMVLGAPHPDQQSLNAIEPALATAYVLGGQPQKGLALAQQIKQRDPSNTNVDDALSNYYMQQANAAAQAGKRDDAVTDLEAGAKAVPSRAASMYVSAANVLAGAPTPDWKRIRAECDKALATDPTNANANYIAGIAAANSNDRTAAIAYLQKAKANAGSDTKLATNATNALQKLGVKP
ncbi:MAG TPA: tetratricopeptide repeat protein [Candidatus Baltobacteraceae bacterium]|nr:tetratricopeptide repeat protein [Candidatus Baltobacteraceae bacterium]